MNQAAPAIVIDPDLAAQFPADVAYAPADFKHKKLFHPWHRPRKQYVREVQWCAAANELVDKLDLDGRALRYLGLPGDELFDLRAIHEDVCKPRDLRLRFLGFNTASSDESLFELNLSQVELKSLSNVDQMSRVVPDDFKSVGTRNSVAWTNANELNHFDIVNIDLCDGLFTSKPGVTSDSYYNAIRELIEFQSRRAEPWLLFMTTRVGPTDVHQDTVQKIKTCIHENIRECEKFVREARRHLDLDGPASVDAAFENPHKFPDLFSTGMAKWLIGLGLGANPKWAVRLKTLCSYKVLPESAFPDLLSAVYEFTPVPVKPLDRHGLVVDRNAAPKVLTECDLAAEIIPYVKNTLDIDAYLNGEPGIFAELVDRSATLMAKARYLPGDYREWVEAQYQ